MLLEATSEIVGHFAEGQLSILLVNLPETVRRSATAVQPQLDNMAM
jgi:hypothetical protein